ncbi:short-chain dehydrogenase/reductase-like protein sdr [Amylocarpus encephaloides]|uniref:Short-chain dehydrogenase/reductase-like protein sdr n=1 Tax=Amylocarpus encephaloides TaxID=45428 RepID=A0A9P8C557_9HELO|nr:short-chain dehydrogenase/reductase-like protein sdr [Amylocarpus encephaloides]
MAHHLLLSKVAAITGGTTGIGRAIALEYVRQGCHVAINHLNLPSDSHHKASILSEAAALREKDEQAGRLIEVEGDISKPETGKHLVEEAVKQFGKLDVFVSNAGVCQFAEFLDLDHDLYASTVRINLDGAFYSCQAAARQMAQQGNGGSIVAISSISALVGGGLQTHYTPTKAGVLSLMQSLAVALGPHKIRCNALLPGTIKTQLNEEVLNDDKKKAYMETRIPLGRTGVPSDLAGPAVFLACDELSGYVNGSQLLVDGGLFVNLQ